MSFLKRLEGVRGLLRQVDSLLVTNMSNVRYLTGFSGSSGFALITKKENIFITDFRYGLQAKEEANGWDITIEKNRMNTIRRLIKRLGIKRLRFEASVSYEFFERLKAGGVELMPSRGLIERLRARKEPVEMDFIREAIRRAETAFLEVLPYIKKGSKEKAIALRLEERLKRQGCRYLPFDIIVASGANSAMPHVRATDKRLIPGDLVIVDWGGEANGYCSDMTRTLLLRGGDASERLKIYGTVLEAQRRAIRAIRDGVDQREIDNTGRNVIQKAGYGKYFGHGLGHGVGLEVHELPSITGSKRGKVKEGMVFTVEPGIYLPGLGGVRIEDMVIVRRHKAELLTSLPRALKIIG